MLAISFSLSDVSLEVVVGGVLIALARVFDVSIGVLRFAAISTGRRKAAWAFAFMESLIWLVVVASIVSSEMNLVHAVFYALGFAFGTFVGMLLEDVFGKGEQVVRIFTHEGDAMAQHFRDLRYRVTQFEGKGLSGPIQLLFIHVNRKKASKVPMRAREVDPECFIVVDDVRSSSIGLHRGGPPAAGVRK